MSIRPEALEGSGVQGARDVGAQRLFPTRMLPASAGAFEYDVTRDGQRFLVGTILDGPNATPPRPVVLSDWTADLDTATAADGRAQ